MRKSRILSILLLAALLFLTLTALSGCFRIQKIDPAPNGAEIDSRTVIHIYIFQPDQ